MLEMWEASITLMLIQVSLGDSFLTFRKSTGSERTLFIIALKKQSEEVLQPLGND